MRAVIITAPGGPEVLEIHEVDPPAKPTADRVRVRVHAAGLNRADIHQRLGKYPARPGFPKDIPGLELAGEVEAIGDEVRSWKVGQRVFGITAGGAQAELVVVPESTLAEIPTELNWAEAAAMPEVFITAHDALFTLADLSMGESVLIQGTSVLVRCARCDGSRCRATRPASECLSARRSALSPRQEFPSG